MGKRSRGSSGWGLFDACVPISTASTAAPTPPISCPIKVEPCEEGGEEDPVFADDCIEEGEGLEEGEDGTEYLVHEYEPPMGGVLGSGGAMVVVDERTPVCRFSPQSSFKEGRLMCSICSTLLGLCVASGVLQDPGSITPESLERALNICMEKSERMQSTLIMQSTKGERAATDEEQMRQVAEVVEMVCKEGVSKGFSRVERVECFGTVSRSILSEEAMKSASSTACPVDVTEHLRGASGCIIKGLDSLLAEDVGPGDGVVVTTGGHTTYMLYSRGAPKRWYLFDSLDGTMDCVLGDGRAVHLCCYSGKGADAMYTAMILRGMPESLPVEGALPVEDAPHTVEMPEAVEALPCLLDQGECTQNGVLDQREIMRRAAIAIRSMGGTVL